MLNIQSQYCTIIVALVTLKRVLDQPILFDYTCVRNKNKIIVSLTNLKLHDTIKMLKHGLLAYNSMSSLIL